jgi:hypothetical protein
VWDRLVSELHNCNVVKGGGATTMSRRVLFRCLDQDGGGTISNSEFRALLGVIEVSIAQRTGLPPYLGAGEANVAVHRRLRAWIRHRWTEAFWDGLVYLNSVLTVWLIALEQSHSASAEAATGTKEVLHTLLTAMLISFVVELGVKIYVDGLRRYWREDIFNKVDFFAIVTGFVLFILQHLITLSPEDQRLVSLARLFRAVRLLGRMRAFAPLVKTFTAVFPGFLTHFTVLLIFYQLFALLGMELFAGRVGSKQQMCCPPADVAPCPCAGTATSTFGPTHGLGEAQVDELVSRELGKGNSAAEIERYLRSNATTCEEWTCNAYEYAANSAFGKSHYWNLNFNTFGASHVVLFYLMIVNNWPVVMEGYVAVAGFSARLFFYAWYMVIVLVVLNIVLAFLLDAFAAQALVWQELHHGGKQPLWRIMVHAAAQRAEIDISRCDVFRRKHFRDLQEALYEDDVDDEVAAITNVEKGATKSANQIYNLAALSKPVGVECAASLELGSEQVLDLLNEIKESDRASTYPFTKPGDDGSGGSPLAGAVRSTAAVRRAAAGCRVATELPRTPSRMANQAAATPMANPATGAGVGGSGPGRSATAPSSLIDDALPRVPSHSKGKKEPNVLRSHNDVF